MATKAPARTPRASTAIVGTSAPERSAALSGDEPGGRCELDDGTPLAIETVRRIACDAMLLFAPITTGEPPGI